MANKNLKSITFPLLPDTYVVPQVDDTLAITGRPADAKEVGDQLTSIKRDLSDLGLSVVDGELCITYKEVTV